MGDHNRATDPTNDPTTDPVVPVQPSEVGVADASPESLENAIDNASAGPDDEITDADEAAPIDPTVPTDGLDDRSAADE